MTAIHIHLTVQQMPSGKWVAKVRRGEYGLTRPHDTRRAAVAWALTVVREELNDDRDGTGAAA